MATFPAPTDRGQDGASIRFEVNDNGDPRRCEVEISLSDGRTLLSKMTGAQTAGALTSAERTALRSILPKIYAAGIASAGGS